MNADHLALTAQGTLDATTLGGDARITLALDALRPFTEPYGQPLDGAADLEATLALGARAELIGIDLAGSFHQLSGLPPGAAELLGATPTVQANAIVVPADSVDITLLRVKGAAATLDGELDLALPEQTLDGTVHLDLPRLAVLAPVLGTEIDGELTARAELSGSIARAGDQAGRQEPGSAGGGRAHRRARAHRIGTRRAGRPGRRHPPLGHRAGARDGARHRVRAAPADA